MKKILSIFIFLGLIIFNACDPMEDIYEDIDAKEDYVTANVEFTLTSDDYVTASSYALKYAESPTYVKYAEYIEEMEAFNMYFTAEEYVPFVLGEKYNVLNKNSVAKVTYNYIADLPEELATYTNTDEFLFNSDYYAIVDSLVNITGYFYPDFNPDLYIPGILADSVSDPNEDDMLIVSYKYADVNPVITPSETVTLFSEGFTEEENGLGQFTEYNITGVQGWVWNSFGDGNAKMSGYDGGAQENENWLVSPDITLTESDSIVLNITQAINFLNDEWDQINILISTNFSDDVSAADWVAIDTSEYIYPAGNSWSFVESGNIDISSYKGQTINFAFKYLSSASNAATWEIADVTIEAVGAGFDINGSYPYTKRDFYQFDGSEWKTMSNTYYLTSKDYDAMGSPGNYANFSNDDNPRDYIPNLLKSMYPTAGEGVSKIVVYKYYTEAEVTLTLADQYTYTNGEWQSLYNYIDEITNQFIHNGTKWVFDPTETYTMSSSDYQIIVDYVKDNYGDDYIDSYGTQEFYYGAGAYYSNFDLRSGNWNSEEFDSWEEAVEEAIGTVLLPEIYPNATLQVNGVDMYYRVVFDTYSGSAARYAMKFQVTKAGPDPEFTFTEGPTLL